MLSSLIALTILQAAPAEAPPQPPVTISPCRNDPAFAAFDFWVGEWDVYATGSDEKMADSRIEKPHNGCGVIETWMPLSGPGGNSISNLEPATGRWHQKWVGARPGMVEFEGGPVGNGMILTGYWADVGGPGRHGLIRMTYTPQPDKSVRQFGEVSYDHGQSWETSFDLTYRRKSGDAE
mgnify:CR=1 FL=1